MQERQEQATPLGDDVLLEVVRAEPGLSAQSIFNSLIDDERRRYSSLRSVERALARHPAEVHRREGVWHPGPARAPTSTEAPMSAPRDSIQHIECLLRQRLAGRRLIAEAGLDAALFEELTTAMEHQLRTRTVEYAARTYPFVFMAFMVGHGVYNYDKGNFWGRLPVARIDNTAGPIFLQRLRWAQLEVFDQLVEQDNATRYVTPILAHGGIPKYCLEDFFSLVIKDMQRVGASAEELLASWRTRKSAFFQVDKPVGRFLLYGGDLAVDLLDRCLAAIEDIRVHGRPPTPDEAGLPPYVLLGLLRHVDEIKAARPRLRASQNVLRPAMVLDPYVPFGPELQLPPVRSEVASLWRLWSTRGVEDLPTSSFETRSVTVPPARSWSLQLSRHNEPDLEWSFEGYDESPALFFDARTGGLLSAGRSIRAGSVWALTPADARFIGVTATGAAGAPRIIEECADLSGSWTGYAVRRLDLADITRLSVTHGELTTQRSIQPESAQPVLIAEPLKGIRTDAGLPVFDAPPRLQLPVIGVMSADQWQVRLTVNGQVHHLAPADDLVVELDPIEDTAVVSAAMLTARGPLGADFKLQFALVSGLTLHVPDRLLFPGERHAAITIGGPRLLIDGGSEGRLVELDARTVNARCRVEGAGTAVSLSIDLPRLVWAPVRASSGSLDYADRTVVVSTEDVESGALEGLAVRTGTHDLPLELQLVIEGATIQTSPAARSSGPDGRWTFGLQQFVDTIRHRAGDLAEFVLGVGQRPVTVLRLRPPVRASDVICSGREIGDEMQVSVRFATDSDAKHRVARLWPSHRPWDPDLSVPVPDGASGVEFSRTVDELPSGAYVVEIEVDDGWTIPVRPSAGAANTSVATLGEPAERWDAIERRAGDASAIELLEHALATGHLSRHLTSDELDEVTPAALDAVMLYVVETHGRLQTARGTRLMVDLLSLDAHRTARAINERSARLALSPTAQAHLSLTLIDGVRYVDHAEEDEALRVLWATAPVLAARVDLGPHPGPGADARLREALEWTPADGAAAIFAGEPVDQTIAGRPAELLVMLRDAIDLVPKSIVDKDTLVAANFEWLIAARSGTFDVEHFYQQWAGTKLRLPPLSTDMALHLERRKAAKGTEAWASFPLLTLEAALSLTAPGIKDRNAHDLLWEAAEFAPKLVSRDLVLAAALLAVS